MTRPRQHIRELGSTIAGNAAILFALPPFRSREASIARSAFAVFLMRCAAAATNASPEATMSELRNNNAAPRDHVIEDVSRSTRYAARATFYACCVLRGFDDSPAPNFPSHTPFVGKPTVRCSFARTSTMSKFPRGNRYIACRYW